MSTRDRARLELLAAERAQRPADGGYQIGADDLIDIRIRDLIDTRVDATAKAGPGAAVPDVQPAPAFAHGFRVSASGAVTIPQLGVVQAQGMTPHGLEQDISRRLVVAGILRTPEVTVTIAEYRSGVVAVVGSVQRPGLYPLTRPGATVGDLIWAAGGPKSDAGRLVQFVPVQSPAHAPERGLLGGTPPPGQRPREVASYAAAGGGGSAVMADVGDLRVGGAVAADDTLAAAPPHTEGSAAPAIRIDLETLLLQAPEAASSLNPQVRPGDVINISPAGNVLVGGWVYRGGSYAVTRGLTVTGAVTAAGGAIFAADASSVTVRRVLGPGEERIIPVDLSAIADGRDPDLAIIDGDVVYLPVDGVKVVPWGLWSLINSLLRFGASFPIV